ncbi:RAP protein, putative [Plasmodium sp. gorilla clade G2]|uniref:RAP protein, putative n=1 Tax=Plasmodium sp. gorilla clade G2 TaxID=880535 RepID=UPI000D227D68|nr:RAP protein, putative [Plasmodium sp. gorilla clade G2]SOV11889.1 RAP protein, putative [Plasmodium sp. gorilla clade G2]
MGGLKICKKFQRTLVHIIKRNYSSTNFKVQREYKKINTLMCYIQRCIDEEHEKNKNLLCFNNVGCHQNNYHMLFYIHMLRMSYLLKNMTVNENKWLHIYKKMTTLYFLDEQYFHIKKKEKNYNEKNILNDHINVIDNQIKSNIIVNNDIINIPPHIIERNICDKYNLFTLYSNYLFVYETILNKIYNYLSIYNTDDMLLLLNICDRFFHIFFTVCNNNKHKRMNKLNYIYIYSNEYNYIHNNNNNNDNNNNNNNSNNFSNNFKIRKKGEKNIYKHRSNHKDIFIHQYEDIYNLKYYQIFINIINLLTNILNTINYNSINSAQLIELINIFYRITKKGIINEKHIIKLFQNNIHIFKDIIKCPYTYNDIIFKTINIMYKSKIINSNIIFPIVIELKNRNIDKYPININFFEIYLKLLTLINLEPPYNLYLYHCCKEYILNNIYNIQPSKVYNFFFISSILGIYNLSILNIYIDYIFKRKDSHLNISSTHKIYYTLLGWSIIYNTILKNKYKHNKRNIKIIFINFNNKNIHYIYDNKCIHINSYYDNLFGKLKYLLYFYKNKLICEKKKKIKNNNKNKNKNNIHKKHNNDSNYNIHHNNNNGMYISLNNNIYTEKENYQFNQFSIYSILKQYYPNTINEYTTNELISLDIFLYIHKQNSYKNIAIEFNGRTHYNLLINKKTSYPQTYTDTYQMVENYNTKYKKWILSNYSLNIIYIPYYKWNMLTHKQKEKYLTEAINMCSDIKSNINTQ